MLHCKRKCHALRALNECYTAAEQDNKSIVTKGLNAPPHRLFSSYPSKQRQAKRNNNINSAWHTFSTRQQTTVEERLVTDFIDKHKPALPSRPPRSLNTILLHVPWKQLQIRSILEAKFLLFKYHTVNNPNQSHHVLSPIYKILCLSRAGTWADTKVRTRITTSSLMHKHSVLISVHCGAVGFYPPLLFPVFFIFFFCCNCSTGSRALVQHEPQLPSNTSHAAIPILI